MEKKYFPESYLRKRQRDQRNLIAMRTGIVVFALVGGSALGAFIFKNYIIPARQQPKASNELAEERSELAMQERLDHANTALPIDSAEGVEIQAQVPRLSMKDLEDREFASSFPLVQVSLQGSVTSPDLGQQTDEPMPGEETADTLIEAPLPTQTPAAAPAVEADKPEDKKPAEKPAVKPEEKEKPKAEEDKPKPEAKPAEKPKTEGKYSIVVYVGPYDSQESAEGKLGDLSALGVSGSVTKYAGAYHVRVASFSEYEKAVALSDQLSSSGFNAFPVRKAN